jgi:exopolysaccharide biosynthesis predicted pyruvyltransferase EpsI
MHSDLERLLRSLQHTNVIYIPNRGNAGDSFIAHATYQLFARIGLTYKVGSPSGHYPGATIILGGGGNLVDPYPNLGNFLRLNLGQWEQLIILPHTIRAFPDVLNNLGSNCFIFCREQPSFAFVKQNAPNAHAFLSHDLAFSCDLSETRRLMNTRWEHDIFDTALLIRNGKRRVRQVAYRAKSFGRATTLNAFRTDIERTAFKIPWLNIDISQAFAADDMSLVSSLYATYYMMTFISRFNIVRTNRLHVGIMSAILGKELHFYDNSYGKNHDVFFHSMRGRFANVRWHADSAATDAAEA